MRTGLSKKYLCLVVTMLFLIPTVAALNVNENFSQSFKNDSKSNKVIDNLKNEVNEGLNDNVFAPESVFKDAISVEVQDILELYSWDELDDEVKEYLIKYNKRMLERRKQFTLENPTMPYEPFEVVGKIAKMDPETGETTSFFPNTDLKPREPVRCDPNNYVKSKLLSNSADTMYTAVPPEADGVRTGSSRAAEVDVELTRLEWNYVQEGWGLQNEIEQDSNGNPVPGDQYSLGGFQVGKTTTFTATFRNNNPATTVKVYINFSISEWYTGVPMDRLFSKEESIGNTPKTVNYDFTPKFAGDLLIQCTLDYINDPDNSNNYIGWRGMPVFIWSADFESGGGATGYGWQKLSNGNTKSSVFNDWTGDTASSGADIWHVTGAPANDNNNLYPSHTQSNAFYHGDDGVAAGSAADDSYGDDMNRNIGEFGRNHTYLQTPWINMGDIMDDERTVRDLPADAYYIDYMVMFSMLMTGETEYERDPQDNLDWSQSDYVLAAEYSDDQLGNYWGIAPPPAGILIAYAAGDHSTLELLAATPQTTAHWNPNFHVIVINQQGYLSSGYLMRRFLADGQGGIQNEVGAKNWTSPGVKFRLDFTGDGEDDNGQITGIYADDFVTWGIQDYVVEDRLGFSEISYPTSPGDVPILYKGTTASVKFKVENFGQKQSGIPVELRVFDKDRNELTQYKDSKSAGSLDTDVESGELTLQFTPQDEGEFYVEVEVGDESKDWTPGDNLREYYVHVRSGASDEDVDVLVVDDDDSGGQRGLWRMNTEDKMLKALDDNEIKYRVYTVEQNETGPSADIMDDYELVIWMTGLDNEIWVHGGRSNYHKNNDDWDVTLKDSDITELKSFLDSKDKKLWLISPGFTYDKYGIDYKTVPPSDFARQYMHVYNCQPNLTQWNDDDEIVAQGTPNPLEGVPDTAMDKAEYATYDMPEPPWGFTDIGGVAEKQDPGDDDTDSLFYQDDAHLMHNALLYKGEDHMACYFAFNFYLIDDKEIDTTTDQTDAANCVYRVLTGFGMTGGVIVELAKPAQQKLQTVYPGKDAQYQLRVRNLGKKEDKMELTVKITYSKDYPTQYKSWNPIFEGKDVVKKGSKYSVTIEGLNDGDGITSNVYLTVTAPTTNDYSTYPDAGEKVRFTIKAVSENTKLENATSCRANIPILGNITMETPKTKDKIEVNEKAEFALELYNETNGPDEVMVELSYSGEGAGLAKFAVKGIETSNKVVTAKLEPNEINDDVELRMIAGEYTLAKTHNVTVYLKEVGGLETYDQADFQIEVEQFYQVECNTTGDELGKSSFLIDPNDYSEKDYINKTFTINVRNYGNWYDTIGLDWEENENSDDTSAWPEPRIYDESSDDDVTSVRVIYNDEATSDDYGQKTVKFDLAIPIDVEVGKYMIDFVIDSSGTEESSLEEVENNRVTFTFRIIKPNLEFTKLDNKTDPNFEFYDEENLQIEEDPLNEYGDYYIERSYKDFDELEIDIKVTILNEGENEIIVNPSDILLNISYEDQDGYTVYRGNIEPITPVGPTPIDKYQTAEFTFRWDPETPANKEPFEYTFKVIIDPENRIFEMDETDNEGEFELWIKHIPKKKSSGGGGGMPGFESAFMIAAILLVLLGGLYTSRRRRR